MFGHAKGAFTGAVGERIGKLEYARGGTVFLDEVESMPLGLQAKILRAIQERTVEPLGSNVSRPIDVASSRRARSISRQRVTPAGSAPISISAWPLWNCLCRHCASGARTFRCC